MIDRNADYRQLKEAIDEIGTVFEEFKTENDKVLEAKASGEAFGELEAKVIKLNDALGRADEKRSQIENLFEADRARLEQLEALLATGGSVRSAKLLEDHQAAFIKVLQTGSRGNAVQELYDVEARYRASLPQDKQINLATAAAGEALVPELISSQIEKLELKLSPVRRLIPFITVGTTDFKQTVDIGGAASGWLAETGTRSVTDTASLRVRTPTWGELYARPQATEWALMDVPNAVQWINQQVVDEFISAEGIAVISGNGTSRPTGIFNTAPVATDDWASPLRSAEAIESVAAPSPDDITEHMLSLIYTLNARYRNGAAWAMNSVTLGEVRRAKDSNGQYLWQPSFQSGEPTMIAGYPFEAWEDMDNTGLSPVGNPILFGNFRRGYLAAQRSDVMLLVDPYTTIGLVSYWFRRREGGIILNNDALKVAQR